MKKTKIHPKDYKFVKKDADLGFDPKRNKSIIDEVIEETDKIAKSKRKEFSDQLEERTDALSTYFKDLSTGGKTSNLMQYFGKKYLLYLKGQDMLNKIQKDLRIVKNGKVIKQMGN